MEDSASLVALVLTTLFLIPRQGFCQDGTGLVCDSYHNDKGIIREGNETCESPGERCFVLWRDLKNERNETLPIIIKKGCFGLLPANPLDHCQDDCIQNHGLAFRHENVSGICCCNIDMCNVNFTSVPYVMNETTTAPTTTHGYTPKSSSTETIVVAIVVIVLAAVIMTSVLVYLYKCRNRDSLKYQAAGLEEKEVPNVQHDLTGLNLEELVGQGRYGSVWRGYYKGEVVAVKTFPPEHRQTWKSEKEVFETHMSHPSILKFYFAAESQKSYGVEYLLVTEYHSKGSLLKFLKCNTVTWQELCVLGRSLAGGLAYLHNDDDHQTKPCFVHRDVSSKNVLVSLGLTCVLSDFGFAMKLPEAGSARSSEDIITEVGTLRYMAPEVLDGALNLRECEASLKEIDVYAMSIVLWEIAMRCSDIYGREPVPDYKPPYEAELGASITSEHIREFVARQKQRPGFPDVWKNNHPGLRTLKETIEDCWDQDGDARLSALCVQERFSELLKDYPDGLCNTPTNNPVQKIVQNYPTSNPSMGFGNPVPSVPPLVIQGRSDKFSSQSHNTTTV